MISQTDGQIYLSNARGITNRSTFRSFHTFNHGNYYDESRKAFGNLIALNDDTLASGNSVIINVDREVEITVIPIVGDIEIQDNKDARIQLEPGELFRISCKKGDYYQIHNPYKNELVNFLQIWQEREPSTEIRSNKQIKFELDKNKNYLQLIGENCHIGKYTGRNEGHIRVQANGIFGFVIEGAFEFQNRLLEARDSLALWNNEATEPLEITFEALSNDAIILIIGVKAKDGRSFW